MPGCRQVFCHSVVAGLFLFTFSIIITGCGNVAVTDALRNPTQGPDQAMVAGIPFYPQEEFQCGPATLAMVLAWSGLTVTPEQLIAEVYTPERKGSLQSALIASARNHGRVAYPLSGPDQLISEVGAGRPVIVLLNLAFSWYPQWHYAVVIGYDRETETIIMHSGTQAAERLSFRVFSNIWGRSESWGLLILPPSEMPVALGAEKWLDAIVGLERAEQWDAALVAYEKASRRWPDNYNFRIGLGNSYYVLEDYAGAASSFREAIRIHPDSGIAYNNLAQVLAQTRQYDEAEKVAKQAVALGGTLQETYRKTFAEIKSNKQHTQQNDGLK